MDDRRQSLRWAGTLACRFTFNEEHSTGRISDLSFEGARITDPEVMPPQGAEIVVTLRPEQENVTLKALIVHVGRREFGIEFSGSKIENVEVLKPFFSM